MRIRRRRKPDYKHIAELERSLGLALEERVASNYVQIVRAFDWKPAGGALIPFQRQYWTAPMTAAYVAPPPNENVRHFDPEPARRIMPIILP